MADNSRNKKKKSRKSTMIAIFAVEFVVLAALIFLVIKVVIPATDTTESTGLNVDTSIAEMEPEEIGISETVQQQTEEGGTMHGYTNIVFFGIDAKSTGVSAIESGSRSDSIIIASINNETGDVKLCSVYRDTYLNTNPAEDSYQKCNAAYAYGGASRAISMLNSNLDLDITDYIAISYPALIDTIDGLGGIMIDVDDAEIQHINNYQITIDQDFNLGGYTPVSATGYQLLNGLQAASYCRIRYTAGDDFKRAWRQREVIQAIVDKAKTTDVDTLIKLFNKVSGNVLTSIDSETLTSLISNIANYNIVAENGFPEESMRTCGTIGTKGSCVIPVDLKSNVIWLHQFLFDDADYVPSETVEAYSNRVYSDTSAYISY